MSDLEPQFKLERDQIVLEEIPSNLLGKGGYAEVYKAYYKGKVRGDGRGREGTGGGEERGHGVGRGDTEWGERETRLGRDVG